MAQITWRDEFDGTSLSYIGDGGTWSTRGPNENYNEGYSDYAGQSWNCNLAQANQYGLLSISNSVLTMKARRNPGIPGVGNAWISTYLVTDSNKGLKWNKGYFEWRARFPNPALGMFPALWLYNADPNYKNVAEIDVLEVFGNREGRPWRSSLHGVPTGSIGGDNNDDITQWHRYGLEWTSDALRIYVDGVKRAEVTGNDAAWFNDVSMNVRMDYVMDPGWSGAIRSTPDDPPAGTEPRMEIDYVRRYDMKPLDLATGSADPLAGVAPAPSPAPAPTPTPTPTVAAKDVWQVNAGGGSVAAWEGASGLVSGGQDGANPGTTGSAAGVPESLYDTERWGDSTWTFPVKTTGDVNVAMYFAERYPPAQTAGARQFNITVNGVLSKTNYEPWAAAGSVAGAAARLVVKTRPINGKITVAFTHGAAGDPFVNAIFVAPTPVANPPALGLPVIARGTTDTQTARTLQSLLIARGTNLTVDGGFGPGTETALKTFQAAQKLSASGQTDDATWRRLLRLT